jgi:N-acetylglucosaminyldiphosphoundecaprenol N-acetyl-beta-D-mannosaminyltransferase
MSERLHKIDVLLMLGVGAAFDFHSGNRSWAPTIVRKFGVEWLFRALTGGCRSARGWCATSAA